MKRVLRLAGAIVVAGLCAVALAARPDAAPVRVAGLPQDVPPAMSFENWLAALRVEAVGKGISQHTVDEALASVERLPVVVERDRTQAELTLTLDQYLKRRVSARVVRAARDVARRQKATLRTVAAAYGVPGSVLTAIWGLESDFGRFTGSRPTIPALATLAFDTRRSVMFRDEILAALRILDEGEVPLSQLTGSWAGAMGQVQFMPSSYLKYAVDFDGDHRRNIWTSTPDVLASIANYLKAYGWVEGQRWGREVAVDEQTAGRLAAAVPLRMTGSCQANRDMTEPRPLRLWRTLGVRLKNGSAVPALDLPASLIRVDSHRFLVYANYEALLGYNCAHTYALSVAALADRIGE